MLLADALRNIEISGRPGRTRTYDVPGLGHNDRFDLDSHLTGLTLMIG